MLAKGSLIQLICHTLSVKAQQKTVLPPFPVAVQKFKKCHGEIYDTKGISGHVYRLQASFAVVHAHVQMRMRLNSVLR